MIKKQEQPWYNCGKLTKEQKCQTQSHESAPGILEMVFFTLDHGLKNCAGNVTIACTDKDHTQSKGGKT